VLAVLLALLSAALFGAMTVALRFGLREGSARDAELGAFLDAGCCEFTFHFICDDLNAR